MRTETNRERNRLTSTNEYRTLGANKKGTREVDATARSLLRQLQELEREDWRIREKIKAIHTALRMAGIKPEVGEILWGQSPHETEYAVKEPFAEATLTESCEQVLKDYASHWLTKSNVEYLITRGGYKSSAKDAKNSVDVTLRRIAADGKCEAERARGAKGNKYRWISRFPRVKAEDESVS